jgi:hypothetical protein
MFAAQTTSRVKATAVKEPLEQSISRDENDPDYFRRKENGEGI